MSLAFPSQGGTVVIIDRAFGHGLLTGAINNLLWLAYIVTLALYAVAFGNYAATFLPTDMQSDLARHLLATFGIALPTALNLLNAELISKTETAIVTLKTILLLIIVATGISSVEQSRLSMEHWEPLSQIVSAGMIIFVAYEGFELIANTAEDIQNPETNLARAYYISVTFVLLLYFMISMVVVGSLEPSHIASSQDFALAEAARPSLGQAGFTLVAVSAVFATLSAINSTLYGSARLSYTIATEGELPALLEKKVWGQPVGLLITSGASIVLANSAELSNISTMGSASFLLIFAMVNLANFVRWREAKSQPVLALLGFFACTGALLSLVLYTARTAPDRIWVLLAMILTALAIEWGYRSFSGKSERRLHSKTTASEPSIPPK